MPSLQIYSKISNGSRFFKNTFYLWKNRMSAKWCNYKLQNVVNIQRDKQAPILSLMRITLSFNYFLKYSDIYPAKLRNFLWNILKLWRLYRVENRFICSPDSINFSSVAIFKKHKTLTNYLILSNLQLKSQTRELAKNYL